MAPQRSLLLAALLLAALAAAQWSDVIVVHVFNATTVKVCAVDDPGVCIFNVVLNKTYNYLTTAIVARWVDYSHPWHDDVMTGTDVLHTWTVVVANPANLPNIDIYVPAGGYIYSDDPWFTVNDVSPDVYTLCGRNVTAVRVARGHHRISASGVSHVYLLLPPCSKIPLVVFAYSAVNFTKPWVFLYVMSMPTAKEVEHDGYFYIFNGTRHVYYLALNTHWTGGVPVGGGYYIANRTAWLSTPLYYENHNTAYGPRLHENAANITVLDASQAIVFHSIGKTPGDGVFIVGLDELVARDLLTEKMEVSFVSDNYGGYFALTGNVWKTIMDSILHKKFIYIYSQRYSIGEVAVKTQLHLFTTRTVACPVYYGMFDADTPYRAVLTRVDTAKEVMICSNATRTFYLRLAVPDAHGVRNGHSFADVVAPGNCSRLRWPGNIAASNTRLYIYADAQSLCRHQYIHEKIGGQDYLVGWRYYLTDDGSLIPTNPIDPDELYAEMWRRLIETMARQYNETINTLRQWLQMQQNATRRIEDYYRSLPQYQGTIRIDSSTSVWLQTVLNEIRRFTVPGIPPPAGGGFTPSPLPGASALSAAAAAAAVATAWAASRRSLASAAFLAGFAILASALFVYYLHGISVAAALIFAAVLLMSIGAAAVWFRKSED